MSNDKNYLNHDTSLMSWLTTVDHKRIGLMYLVSSVAALIVGGIFALLIRLQLAFPEAPILPMTGENAATNMDQYNQFFTLHGVIMVFLFIIPAIPGALGNFVLPIMVGAKDVAFPRMNLASYYIYVVGSILALVAIAMPVFGASDPLTTGWTFYTPYSSDTAGPVIMMTFAAFVLGFSSIFTGLNFIVTLHKLRAPGMTWYRMPLFLWSLYATSALQVLATPVLGITLCLLIAENSLDIAIFNPDKGGDPVLFQHFFWFYSHPAVYIMILPGMGVISEVISTFSKKTIFGYKAIANSSMAIAVISFFVWGHHMFLSGQSTFSGMVFSFLTFLVAIPSAIKVFNWVTTLHRASIKLDTPMVYALSFLFLFTIGGLTGLYLGALGTDVILHDTYFVVAHFHYVMFGGTAIAFFSGLHFWWPKMTGFMYNEFWGKVGAFIIFMGFNITFIPQFILGSLGMPRRYASYTFEVEKGSELLNPENLEKFNKYAAEIGTLPESVERWRSLHGFSSVGSLVLGVGILIMIINLVGSLLKKRKAEKNPWGATTLEWEAMTPPVHENFDEAPVVTCDPYLYDKKENA